jgi:pimeloyl-ACP methyl ester carboxylesterase
MRRAGYRWELRRNGELKIGLWRKSWQTEKAAPSRKLVFVPGFGDTPMSWLGVLSLQRSALRKNYDEIVLVDFPGFAGFLSHERAFHSMELLKNSLFDVLDSLKPKTVMGHSLGGWLAMLYGVECGESLRPKLQAAGPGSAYSGPENLILADPSGVFADEAASNELRDKFRKALAPDGGFNAIRNHVFAKEPFWVRWFSSHFSGFFQSEEIARFVESFEASHLVDEKRLGHVRAKVWLIWGEQDTLVPPTSIPLFLKKLNQEKALCRAIMIKNAGHSPQLEAPAALAIVLGQILTEASGGRARYHSFPASQRFWKLVEES